MGLKAVVKADNDREITTIAADGKQPRYLHRPKRKNASPRAMYLPACKDHTKPTPTVPVELNLYNAESKELIFIRTAKVCPLCWEVLD